MKTKTPPVFSRTTRSSFLSLAASLLAVCSLHATIIYNDNFNTLANGGARNASGQYSTGSAPSTWWYVNVTGSGPTGLVTSALNTPAATGNFSGNWIQTNFNANGGNTNSAISPFSAVSLTNIGDSITVQFDFRYLFDTSGNGTDRSPQFGFYNGTAPTGDMSTLPSVVSGYNVNCNNAATDFVFVNRATGGFTADTQIGSAVNVGSAFSGAFTENYTFTLTKTGNSSIQADLYLNNILTLSVTDTSATSFTFNEFYLRARGTAQIDNFVISAVPEPSAAAFVALGALIVGITFRRRVKLINKQVS